MQIEFLYKIMLNGTEDHMLIIKFDMQVIQGVLFLYLLSEITF